jgi:branched-chain amino acid transport system permease protein
MRGRYTPLLILGAFVVGIQLTTALTGTAYFLTQLTMTAYYTLVVVGLCILMGYAGQISIGHAGFFAIGGYTSAYLTTLNLTAGTHSAGGALLVRWGVIVPGRDLYGAELAGLHPGVAFLAALMLAALIAVIIGIPVLRLKGHYLAMATLGFGLIVYRVVLGTAGLGSADGLSDVPAFKLGAGVMVTGGAAFRVVNYYVAWGLVSLGALLVLNLMQSRAGRALAAIHGNEPAAQAMGIDTSAYKLRLFVFSAILAAAAGALMTHYTGGIGPSEAGVMKSVRYVAIVAVGGMSNVWGTIAASAILNFLSLRGYFGIYDDAVFGGILVFMMLFAPQGLLARETFANLIAWVRRKGGK